MLLSVVCYFPMTFLLRDHRYRDVVRESSSGSTEVVSRTLIDIAVKAVGAESA